MLRDGKFIREEPPKIGANYFPLKYRQDITEEEYLMQGVLLGEGKSEQRRLGVVLFWVAVVAAIAFVMGV